MTCTVRNTSHQLNWCAEVVVPVVDVRSEPTNEPLMVRGHDRRRLTQLLSGHSAHVVSRTNGWYEVDIAEQMMGHAAGVPRPYRGYVVEEAVRRRDCRCDGQSAVPPWSAAVVDRLCCVARRYLSHRYLWGGLSAYNSAYQGTMTGVDCSGLVWLAYKDAGMVLPRDAVDQWYVGHRCAPQDLLAGDLVFTAPKEGKVNHVMMWTGETLLESTEWGAASVQESAFETRFGFSLSDVAADGAIVDGRQFFFRKYHN